MSSKASSSGLGNLLRGQLQDPLRLRFILCAVLLAAWYFGHHSPATDYIQRTAARTETEKKRIATAQQVEKLRKALEPYARRIPSKEGPNELIQYVMAHVRRTPLKLLDLSPGRDENAGTLRMIELRLKLLGSYTDLDAFLTWVEHDQRLLRVDSLKVSPSSQQQSGVLGIDVSLLGLVDAPQGPGAEKAATKDKPGAKK